MRLVICGSLTFIEKMKETANIFKEQGHDVFLPRSAELNQTKEYWAHEEQKNPKRFLEVYSERMRLHFNTIVSADGIIVLNYSKDGVQGYIGPNTIMEMAIAWYHKKKIFILYDVLSLPGVKEIASMRPTILHGNVHLVH